MQCLILKKLISQFNKIIRLKRLPLCYTKTKYGCLYLNSSYSNIKIAKSAKKEKKKIDHSFERALYLTSVYTYLYIYIYFITDENKHDTIK